MPMLYLRKAIKQAHPVVGLTCDIEAMLFEPMTLREELMNYTVEALRTVEDILEHRDEWLAFEETLDNLQLETCYKYLLSYWQNFCHSKLPELGTSHELLVLFLRENNTLLAIYPFCKITRKRKKVFKVRSIEFIGQQISAGNYLDIISNEIENEAHQFVFDWLYQTEQFDYIFLNHIPDFSPNKNSVFYQHQYFVTYSSEAILTNKQCYEEYRQCYPKKIRQKLNLLYSRINKSNYKLNFIIKDFEEDDLNEFRRLADHKNQKKHIENHYSVIGKKEFIESLYTQFKTKVYYAQLNDQKIAFITNIQLNNHAVLFDTAYDLNYQDYSPGILLFDECIKQGINNANNHIVFGWGVDFFKFRLCNRFVRLSNSVLPGNKMFSTYWHNEVNQKCKNMAIDFQKATDYLMSVTKHLTKHVS